MTRINTIDPRLLLDQHLIAEWRELPRIPNELIKHPQRLKLELIPSKYTLGKGHVTFFRNKLLWLSKRHKLLCKELDKRGINRDPSIGVNLSELPTVLKMFACNDWEPNKEDHYINIERLFERWHLRKRKYTYNSAVIDCNKTFLNYRYKVLAYVNNKD